MNTYEIESLHRTYGNKVYYLAFRLTGNQQDAEDATQETFLRVQRGLKGFRGESGIYTWIYRIAVNTCLQMQKRLDKVYLDNLEEKIDVFKEDIPSEVRDWENDPEKRHLYDSLVAEIRRLCYHFMTFRLTDEQRVVYILRVVLGLSLDEISAILEIDKNTVKARLQRAKSNLGSYFSSRCQWLGGDKTCSCQSRIGFALSIFPDLLDRINAIPYDEPTKKTIRESLKQIGDIDRIYKSLPEVSLPERFFDLRAS
jgi:RNA polymerase sigma-70 factor (ECF subfamily)